MPQSHHVCLDVGHLVSIAVWCHNDAAIGHSDVLRRRLVPQEYSNDSPSQGPKPTNHRAEGGVRLNKHLLLVTQFENSLL